MSSPTLAGDLPLPEVIEQVSLMHSTFSISDFCTKLQDILATTVGYEDLSLIEVNDREARVLHSTRLENLRGRLTPPAVEPAAVRTLFETDGEGAGERLRPGASIVVEGTELPVVEAWRLGAGGPQTGYLLFHSQRPTAGQADSDAIAKELRRNASVAFFRTMERERTQEQLDLFQAKLQVINEVGELLGSLDLELLLTKLMELSLYIASGQVGSIILLGKNGVESKVEWGLPLEMARAFRDADGQAVFEKVLSEGKPELVLDFSEGSAHRIEGFDVQVASYLCIPLTSKRRTLGVINLVNSIHEGSGFSELDREILMTISGLAATSIENAMLYHDSIEKERYSQSLAIARDIQKRLYPAEAPQLPGLDIAWRSESCDETGGDYFDFITAEGLTIAIGDVSGHGIGAALLMASARSGLRAGIGQGQSTAESIRRLNDQLEQDMEIERFMTLFIATLDLKDGSLEFVNAGHDAPCLYRADSDEIEVLGSTGMPLGLFSGSDFRSGSTASLSSGDVLLLTTDGVWEVSNRDGEMLGKEKLIEIFQSLADQPAQRIADGILQRVASFTEGQPARDDVTLVVVRVT